MKCSVLRKNLPKHLAANVFIALCNRSGRNACITNIWKCFIYQVKTYINNAVINMPKWSMQRQLLKASETNDRLGEDWKKIFLEHFHKMSIFSQCRQSPAWSRHIYYKWKSVSLWKHFCYCDYWFEATAFLKNGYLKMKLLSFLS